MVYPLACPPPEEMTTGLYRRCTAVLINETLCTQACVLWWPADCPTADNANVTSMPWLACTLEQQCQLTCCFLVRRAADSVLILTRCCLPLRNCSRHEHQQLHNISANKSNYHLDMDKDCLIQRTFLKKQPDGQIWSNGGEYDGRQQQQEV